MAPISRWLVLEVDVIYGFLEITKSFTKKFNMKNIRVLPYLLVSFGLLLAACSNKAETDQEMQTQASTGVTYWEGSVSVNGSAGKQPLKGAGYVELTGYVTAFNAPM